MRRSREKRGKGGGVGKACWCRSHNSRAKKTRSKEMHSSVLIVLERYNWKNHTLFRNTRVASENGVMTAYPKVLHVNVHWMADYSQRGSFSPRTPARKKKKKEEEEKKKKKEKEKKKKKKKKRKKCGQTKRLSYQNKQVSKSIHVLK